MEKSKLSETESDPLLGSESSSESSDEQSRSLTFERSIEIEKYKATEEDYGNKLVISSLPVVCILGTELCERITFFSVTGNLVIFCTNVLEMHTANAVTLNLLFVGLCFMVPAFAGWLADAILGKYKTILISGILFVIGLALLPVVALDYVYWVGHEVMSVKVKTALFMTGILLIAFGTGGLKSNVSIFGAEQVQHMGPKYVTSYFNWFYWFVNVGGFIAYSVVVYVQQEISFAIGYMIPFVFMLIAVILFVIPTRRYVHKPPGGTDVLTRFFRLQWHAFEKYRVKKHVLKLPSIYDYASFKNGGNYEEIDVEGAKALWRMFPIFAMSVVYGCLFSQTSNTYLLQGIRLDLQIGSFTFPAASLSLINITVILCLVPFLDRILFPFLLKRNYKPSMLQRIGIGFAIVIGSVSLGGGLEMARKQDILENGPLEQNVAGVVYNASHLSVFWQIPQYVFMGSSEVFSAITGDIWFYIGLEFSYSQSPVAVRGFVMGMYLVTNGAGFLLGSALLNIVNKISAPDEWIPDEINEGHVDYFLFLLGGLMLVDVLLFMVYTWNYKYANYGPQIPEPIVQEIVGRLSDSSTQSRGRGFNQSEGTEKSPLFPSKEARLEARRRSYGSAEAFDFEPIFPTRAHRAEAQRRSYGTAASFEADQGITLSSTPGSGTRLKANRQSLGNLQGKINRLSEEADEPLSVSEDEG